MSSTDSGQTKREKYSKVDLTPKGKVIISKELQGQIDFLHKEVGSYEWIGILLYKKLEGDIADPSTLVLKAEKLFPMDIGTSTSTKAEISAEEVMVMYDKVPDILELKQGLIHTHHTMDSFFSGEDWDELDINVGNHNYYLSLIVNFKGTYVAKIAYLADVVNVFTFKNSDDEEKSMTSQKKIMMVFDLEIVKELGNVTPDFIERYEDLKKSKKKSTYVTHSGPHYNWGRVDDWDDNSSEGSIGKKDVGEVGQGTGFRGVREEHRGGGRTTLRIPSDSLTHTDARAMLLQWLNDGLAESGSPRIALFSTCIEGLAWLGEYYRSRHASGEYKRFLDIMQRILVDISSDYKPSVTERALSIVLGDYCYAGPGMTIAKDLKNIVAAHPQFIAILRKIEKDKKNNKKHVKDKTWGD